MLVKQYLEAIRLMEIGDWDSSHRIVQQYNTKIACWIHAYLHRVEGDLWNAKYWYNRAGKEMPSTTLDEERNQIKSFLLKELV